MKIPVVVYRKHEVQPKPLSLLERRVLELIAKADLPPQVHERRIGAAAYWRGILRWRQKAERKGWIRPGGALKIERWVP